MTVGELALALDRREIAQKVMERLAPYAGLQVTCGRVWWGPLTYFLAVLARDLGDTAAGVRYLERAVADSRAAGSRLYEALSLKELRALGADRQLQGEHFVHN